MCAYEEAKCNTEHEINTWKPSPGESLSGVVLGYEVIYAESERLLSCMIHDGEQCVRVLLTSTSLLGRFRLLDLKAGDALVIKCTGERTGGALSFDVEYIGPSRDAPFGVLHQSIDMPPGNQTCDTDGGCTHSYVS